jgi:hypothetical protein
MVTVSGAAGTKSGEAPRVNAWPVNRKPSRRETRVGVIVRVAARRIRRQPMEGRPWVSVAQAGCQPGFRRRSRGGLKGEHTILRRAGRSPAAAARGTAGQPGDRGHPAAEKEAPLNPSDSSIIGSDATFAAGFRGILSYHSLNPQSVRLIQLSRERRFLFAT